MTVAQIRQWFYVIPLLSIEAVQEKWRVILPLISRKAAIARAKRVAKEIGEVGELDITYYKQHIGFIRLFVESRGRNRKSWCVNLRHCCQFRGRLTSVPDMENAQHIRFKFRETPLVGGDPTSASDYLKIERVD